MTPLYSLQLILPQSTKASSSNPDPLRQLEKSLLPLKTPHLSFIGKLRSSPFASLARLRRSLLWLRRPLLWLRRALLLSTLPELSLTLRVDVLDT